MIVFISLLILLSVALRVYLLKEWWHYQRTKIQLATLFEKYGFLVPLRKRGLKDFLKSSLWLLGSTDRQYPENLADERELSKAYAYLRHKLTPSDLSEAMFLLSSLERKEGGSSWFS